jgi:AcrR family transcriptional regulator
VAAVPEDPGLTDELTAQERSVTRSLTVARARAVDRYERLVGAAFDLLAETGSTDFTLQDVAVRAKVSLRAFYQHFSSRDDLLLAVFEHGIASSRPVLAEAMARHADPVEALHAYVTTFFGLVFDDEHPQNRPLTAHHLHLAQTNPSALARALAPRDELLLGALRRGVEAGVFRSDIDVGSLALLLSQTLTAIVHTNVLGTHVVGAPLDVDTVWAFCLGAVGS